MVSERKQTTTANRQSPSQDQFVKVQQGYLKKLIRRNLVLRQLEVKQERTQALIVGLVGVCILLLVANLCMVGYQITNPPPVPDHEDLRTGLLVINQNLQLTYQLLQSNSRILSSLEWIFKILFESSA